MRKYLALLFVVCLLVTMSLANVMSAGKEITFWTMPNGPQAVYADYLKGIAADFKKETGITVKWEVIQWDLNKVTSAVVSGQGCDVTQVGTTWNPGLASTGGLQVIDANKFGGVKNFAAGSYNSTIYKGKSYGIPWFAETRCLFYNKDMFAKAGVQPPKTWDELTTVGKKIIAKLGKGKAMSMAGTGAWDIQHNWAPVLWSNGGDLLSKDNKKATLNSQAGIKALNWYLGLLKEGLADKSCAEFNQPQADSYFINENAAMCVMGPWNIADIQAQNPKLNYGVVELPAGTKGRSAFAGGSNLVIPKGSKNQAEAIKWIQFLTRKDVLVKYCKDITHFLPPTVAAINDPYYGTGVYKVFKTTLAYAKAYPTLGVWNDIEAAVQTEMKNAISAVANGTDNKDTAKTALDNCAAKINAALAKEK